MTPEDYADLQKQMLKLQQENEILKSYSHIHEKVTNDKITALIDQENDQYPVHTLCRSARSAKKHLLSNKDCLKM